MFGARLVTHGLQLREPRDWRQPRFHHHVAALPAAIDACVAADPYQNLALIVKSKSRGGTRVMKSFP